MKYVIVIALVVLAAIIGRDINRAMHGDDISRECKPTDFYAQGNKGRAIRIYDCSG